MLIYWLMFGLFAFAALFHDRHRAVAADHSSVIGERKPSSVWSVITGIFLIAIIGLRYRVGGDWDNYFRIYYSIYPLDLFGALGSGTEPGYAFLNWFAGQFDFGIWFVNCVCAAAFTIGLLRLSSREPNPWLALLVATPFLIIVVAMGFTRQAAAMGFLMMGLAAFLQNGSLAKFIIYTCLGALFHKSVLVFLPIIPALVAKDRVLGGLFAFAVLVLGYLFVVRSGTGYEAGYINAHYDAAGANIRVLMNVVPALLLLASGNRLFVSRDEKRLWKTFAIMALLAGLGLFAVSSSVIVDRLGMYLIPLQMFVLCRVPYAFASSERGTLALRFAVILYSAAVQLVWLNFGHFASSWVPYGNYLFGSDWA